MGIYIPNMEMPSCCKDCPCEYDGWCQAVWIKDETDWTNPYVTSKYQTERSDYCPLIEVPPHGDLIDRDALIKDGWLSLHKEVMRMGGYAVHELPLKNPTIPVIIEAETCNKPKETCNKTDEGAVNANIEAEGGEL